MIISAFIFFFCNIYEFLLISYSFLERRFLSVYYFEEGKGEILMVERAEFSRVPDQISVRCRINCEASGKWEMKPSACASLILDFS